METLLRVGLSNAVAAGLLALAAASVGVFARGRPAIRHGLWILVLLKLVTPPLWTVPVGWVAVPQKTATQRPETVAALSDGEQALRASAPEPNSGLLDESENEYAAPAIPAPALSGAPSSAQWPWREWVLMLWATGSLLTFGLAAWRIRQFQSIVRLAEPAPESLRRQVEVIARRFGLADAPTIGLVPGVVSPLVWCLGRGRRLIVPLGLWDRLDECQRDTLLAHELAHLRRRDHWVRCLELLVTGLYWWLPIVWIARHALREAEEQCCDAWVVWAFPDATRTYAEALLETLDFLSGAGPAAAVAASGLGPVHHLKRRMTMIMQGTTPRALTWSGLLAVLGLSATLLPLSPTWAQQRPALEEDFFITLKKDLEFNNPRWPFLIKVKDVQDKTLIDATFKHRAGSDQPDSFDMVVQAKKATIEFDKEKRVARVHFDSAEITNPREDVILADNQTLEIPIPGDQSVADEEDEETSASAAEEPAARDRGSRPKRDGDRRDAPKTKDKREVRTFRFNGEELKEGSEALEKALAELRELASRKEGGIHDERARGEIERAIQRLQAMVQRGPAEAESPEFRTRGGVERPQPPPRRPDAGKRPEPDAAKDSAEAKERRAEVAKLREEVAERQKALMEAHMRLAKAMRQLGGDGPLAREERFEFRFSRPGQGPPAQEKMMKIPQRPFGPDGRPVGPPGLQEKTIRIIPRPDQDRRIAELEERLEKLQDEVKTLKKDAPEKK